ncbi:MAG: hypothetical protein R3Y57_00115 [Erysipelotrichaceae bacterium]
MMKAKTIIESLNGNLFHQYDSALLEKEYQYVFASDLMSDALAMIQEHPETTVLLTGLCNAQSLRSAEMLDVDLVIYVRGKKLQEVDFTDFSINIYGTDLTMFEACGKLYQLGLKAPIQDV